ncbi:MAG: bifunctional riboflavin kinase/FMN adenylyltransferase [Synergistaceae bacterium]|jgi:riboflavin kinase/FMN adenylyltransferase|nr:bifunctional riboflavin kinase/FMN adenylyltransferase [Synergistaceae bacterium]
MIAVLGAFDGIHRGHAVLLRRAASLSDDWGIVTFDPHPGVFLGTMDAVLFTAQESRTIRAALGVPRTVLLRFDDAMARLSPSEFWAFLRSHAEIDGVVIGRDFRFGFGRTGDAALMEAFCRASALPCEVCDLVAGDEEEKISSTAIRGCVSAGRCEDAAALLGYPYFISAEVVHGDERGRSLGFPTANLNVRPGGLRPGGHDAKLLPAEGVYSAAAAVSSECTGCTGWVAGALSVGRNPTFAGAEVRAEAFLLDFSGDLYGTTLTVFLLSRLRGQTRFDGPEALKRQIERDVGAARMDFAGKWPAEKAEAWRRALEKS